MEELQKKIDAVMRLVIANSVEEQNAALEEVRRLLEEPNTAVSDAESIIREILLEIGVQDHLIGYPMVIEGVMLTLESRMYIENITHKLYPAIAEAFDTTVSSVERAIRYLIENAWLNGDPEQQYKLFGNTVNPNKCKPSCGQFIARITNITKQRLKMA